MSHTILADNFKSFTSSDFVGATMLASTGYKRLWMIADPFQEKRYFLVKSIGDSLDHEENGSHDRTIDFDKAIALYNSINNPE